MARNFNSFSRGLENPLNQVFSTMAQLAEQQVAKGEKISTKKKVIKKQVKQSTKGKQENNRRGKKDKSDDEKSYSANKERESQYAELEARHRQNDHEGADEGARLREALVLAEIIGEPRCRARRHRGARSSYGN